MTLIDFGAVGNINMYEDDSSIKTLLEIIVMSLFSNFDEMLDVMTNLLNSKCVETRINTNSPEYQQLKQELYDHKKQNIMNEKIEAEKTKIYQKDIFSNTRINDENTPDSVTYPDNIFMPTDSIYTYLEFESEKREPVIENKDVLPHFTEIIGDSESISFAGVLEKIIKFYALSGVNIAIKFNEFYEFQKAYALLLGVLHQVGYNSYRTGIAINKAIVNWKNLKQLYHIKTVAHLIKTYWHEKKKYDEFKKMNIINDLPFNDLP